MKKQKLAVAFAALLTMVGFSSCLNGDNDPTVSPQELMRVNGGTGFYSFTSAYGYTVTPLNMSDLSNLSLQSYAIVQYSYDSSVLEWNEDKKVTVNNVVSIKDDFTFPKAPEADAGNAPLYTISSSMAQPMYFDKYNLFIPVTYYYKNSSDSDDLKAELNSHSFALYYDPNDAESTDGKLLLHLRHKVADTEVQRSDYGTEYRHFNITSVLSSYASAHRVSMPDKLVIEYERSSSSSYENKTSEKLEINYKSVFEQSTVNQ